MSLVCLYFLIIQIKINMRYHITPIRIGTIKKKKEKTADVSKVTEKLELLYIVSRNVKWYSLCGKEYDSTSKD